MSMSWGPDTVKHSRNHVKEETSAGAIVSVCVTPPVDAKSPPGLRVYRDISSGPERQWNVHQN